MQYSQGPSNTGLLPNLHPVVMTTVTGLFGASPGLHQRGVQEACTGHWKVQHPWSSGRDSYLSVTDMTRGDRLKGNISITYVALVPLRRERRLHVPPPLLLYHPRGVGSLVRLLSENLLMRCTCCLLLALRSEAAGCNHRMPMWIGSFSLHSKWTGARSGSHRSVPKVLLWFPGWTTCFMEKVCNGVQRGLRYVFSCLVGVSKMSAQSAATCEETTQV